MRVFEDRNKFEDILGGHKKWDRVLEALAASERNAMYETHSVGDSLTWLKIDDTWQEAALQGSRQYVRVIVCLAGEATVFYARQSQLHPLDEYSDESDYQSFKGEAEQVVVKTGEILVLTIDEASKVVPGDSFQGLLIRVTKEGHSFHNK
ncbi:YhcH/YjgK/YiaL family protein [Arcanobacterium buesumense]|uniref:DUF386 family protein n=1 Tax=Arcanobacterium buesumense TaxID=2722751 RepID=A0A6H2EM15_9ACTO|nr:YhcH/YjgK/YiaL family protein [Arcanobacterium buesumense]QJC22113.1 DUF386 family protein [Arcanobacterium buesumense]